jgi:hypothetical protein
MALLYCDLRDPRERFSILVKRSSVTNNENFTMLRDGAIWLNANPSGAIRNHV